MTIYKNRVLRTSGERPILYDRFTPDTQHPVGVVLFCHGYKGFKDWGGWHLVAAQFAEAGFDFWKFNFSHNGGTVDDPIDFPDLEAFALNNYSKELDDLGSMLDMVCETQPDLPIYVIGHSRGGGIVLLRAAMDSRINKVVSWAGVSDYRSRFFEESPAFEEWKRTGITYIENSRTGQQLPHKWQFYENFIANEERLTISKAVKSLRIPQLIVHGSDDPTVGIKEAQAIHQWNPDSELYVISGGDHVFGMKHPWEHPSLPEHMSQVVEETMRFLLS